MTVEFFLMGKIYNTVIAAAELTDKFASADGTACQFIGSIYHSEIPFNF
jgi:hypothetical protein